MSLLPMENPASSGLALAMQLGDLLRGVDERNRANAAAQSASADYSDLYRALMAGVNQSNPLIQALLQRMTEAGDPIGELDEEAIRQREMQRFSALAPSVDRAHALAASQGFAQAMRSGMMDSTQAADQMGRLTRDFSDVYSKLQENARTTAFSEALERLKAMMSNNNATSGQLQAAMQGVNQYAQNAQRIASERNDFAQGAKASASSAWQEALMKAIDSPLGKRALEMADQQLGRWLDSRQQPTTPAVTASQRYALSDMGGSQPAPQSSSSSWLSSLFQGNTGSGTGLRQTGSEGLQWPTGGGSQGINPSFNLGTGSSSLMSGTNTSSSKAELLDSYNDTNNSWSSGSSWSAPSWSSASFEGLEDDWWI